MARVLPMRQKAGAKKAAVKRRRRSSSVKAAQSAPRRAGGRPLWRGFLSFGLVQFPVELYAAESASSLDFDLLDQRDMAPIGYRKVNKRTGQEVPEEEIVRGVEIERGRHIVVSDEEISDAAGESHRTIELAQFVETDAIPPTFYERPLYLLPGKGGERVYSLLAHALAASGRLGVGKLFLRTRESLAAVLPFEGRLLLNLLRWPSELRTPPSLPSAAGAAPRDRELAMARRLIDEMSEPFRPADYSDRFESKLLELVRKRQKSGKRAEPAPRPARRKEPDNVVDLVALLEKSVSSRRKTSGRPAASSSRKRARRAS